MRKRTGAAKLVLSRKRALRSGLLVDRKIWRVPKSEAYPLGIKYRLVLVDPKTHEVVLLYDNHYPKGPHVHRRGRQQDYSFLSVELLLADFHLDSETEERRYREN